MPGVLRGRLPPVASVVGVDPESEMLFAVTAKGELLGYDLESGRVDTVATGVAHAALGPDGTLFTVDTKKRVVSLERRVRVAWPQPLAAMPRELFGASDGRLIAIVTQDQPRVITAASDQPPAVRDLLLSGEVAITRWGELLAVASDSGVTLVDPFARRAPAFVPLADHPRALAFSPAGHRLYVARRTSPGLAVIDRFERKEIDGVALPLPATDLRVDRFGRWLLARPATGDSVWIVDLPIKRLVGAVPGGWNSDLPDVAPDGALLVRTGADVVALQPDSLKQTGRVAGTAADLWVLTTWLPRGSLRALADAAQGVTPVGDTTGGALYVQVSVSQNQDWSTEMAQQLSRAGLAARVLPPHIPMMVTAWCSALTPRASKPRRSAASWDVPSGSTSPASRERAAAGPRAARRADAPLARGASAGGSRTGDGRPALGGGGGLGCGPRGDVGRRPARGADRLLPR